MDLGAVPLNQATDAGQVVFPTGVSNSKLCDGYPSRSNSAYSLNRLMAPCPLFIPSQITIIGYGIDIGTTGVAGEVLRFALMTPVSGTNFLPSAMVANSEPASSLNVNAIATGFTSALTSVAGLTLAAPLVLPRGWYHPVSVYQGGAGTSTVAVRFGWGSKVYATTADPSGTTIGSLSGGVYKSSVSGTIAASGAFSVSNYVSNTAIIWLILQ